MSEKPIPYTTYVYPESQESNNKELLRLFQEVAQFSKAVSNTVNNVHIVTSQVGKVLEPPSETTQHTSCLNWGKEHSKLFADFIQDAKESINLLERVTPEDCLNDIDVNLFHKHLDELSKSRQANFQQLKYFKMMSMGVKKVTALIAGKQEISIGSMDTIIGFSDFLEENTEVATSSPFPSSGKRIIV